MIEEKGPWSAAFGNGKAFIESDDFTHDVRLYVSGDFESIKQKVEYAEEIARRLNTFASYDAEVAELVAALKPFGAIDLVESRLPAEFAMLILRARAAIAKVRKP